VVGSGGGWRPPRPPHLQLPHPRPSDVRPHADDPPTEPIPLLGGASRHDREQYDREPYDREPYDREPYDREPYEPAPVAESRLAGLLRRVVPAGWRGARVDPARPGATALVLVAAAAAVVAAVGVWTDRPRAEPIGDLPTVAVATEPAPEPAEGPPAAAPELESAESNTTGPAPTAAGPTPPPAALVVSVSGKVRRPGLVEVPAGSRVADVLDAAGGALPGTDLAGLNLARRVVDGEQVAVAVPPAPDAAAAPGAAQPAGAAGPAAPAGKVDLNSATVAQLDVLPGVGPVTAQRILEWRTRNGRFARVDQLREVDGIGERRFAQLRELVTV
jgi:competence protein ComEA